MGFADASTAALLVVRQNLLRGLDLVAASLDDGTFHTTKAGKASPPSQSGQLTLALLNGVDAELATRKDET